MSPRSKLLCFSLKVIATIAGTLDCEPEINDQFEKVKADENGTYTEVKKFTGHPRSIIPGKLSAIWRTNSRHIMPRKVVPIALK